MKMTMQIPIPLIREFSGLEDFHFALAQFVLTDKVYAREYYNMRRGFTVIDNGVHETGAPMDIGVLVQAAWIIGAEVLIPPDYFFNQHLTLNAFYNSCDYVGSARRLWPVIQGTNFGELMECYVAYVEAGVETICIPYRIGTDMRKALLPNFSRRINHHFLGINNLAELSVIKRAPNPSFDTGKAFRWAQAGRRLHISEMTYKPEKKVDMYSSCDIELAFENVKELRKWTS